MINTSCACCVPSTATYYEISLALLSLHTIFIDMFSRADCSSEGCIVGGGEKWESSSNWFLSRTMMQVVILAAEGKIEEAIKEGFLSLDEKMKHDEEMREDMSGTTAVVVIIKNKKIYCGTFYYFIHLSIVAFFSFRNLYFFFFLYFTSLYIFLCVFTSFIYFFTLYVPLYICLYSVLLSFSLIFYLRPFCKNVSCLISFFSPLHKWIFHLISF